MSLTITSPSAYQVLQRSSGVADIAIEGTYVGSPTAIEASWNGGDYATIDSSPSGGNFSGTLSSQPQGQGTLTVRFTNDTGENDTVEYLGVGDVIICAGQSNMVGWGDYLQAYWHPTLKAGMFGNNYQWRELIDPYDQTTGQVDTVSQDGTNFGSMVPLLASHIMHTTGVPVAFVPCAKGSTSANDWQPPVTSQDRTTLFGSMSYRIDEVGGAAMVIWHQGEQDVTAGTSKATYKSEIAAIASQIETDHSIPFYAAKIHNTALGDETNVWEAMDELWEEDNNVYAGPDLRSITTSPDATHFETDAALQELADEWWLALREYFGGPATYRSCNYFVSQMARFFPLGETGASTTIEDVLGADGTLVGGDTPADITDTGPNTTFPNALHLDGSSDFVDFDTENISGNLLVSFWAKRDTTAAVMYVLGAQSGGTTDFVGFSSGDTNVRTRVDSTVYEQAHGATSTNWNHYTLVRSRKAYTTDGYAGRVYLNGVLQSVTLDFGTQDFAPSRIGAYQGFGPFDGSLAGVMYGGISDLAAPAELAALFELQPDGDASLTVEGAYDVGDWALPYNLPGTNGTVSYEVRLVNGSTVLETVASSANTTGTFSTSPASGFNYLEVRASNDGDYDLGDSPVGGSSDGWYRVASVTVSGIGLVSDLTSDLVTDLVQEIAG